MEDKAFHDWFNSLKTTSFNLFIWHWGSDWGDPANWHNQLFESSADFYHAHWKNDEFDTLVNDARGLADAAQRLAMYEQAEAILNPGRGVHPAPQPEPDLRHQALRQGHRPLPDPRPHLAEVHPDRAALTESVVGSRKKMIGRKRVR